MGQQVGEARGGSEAASTPRSVDVAQRLVSFAVGAVVFLLASVWAGYGLMALVAAPGDYWPAGGDEACSVRSSLSWASESAAATPRAIECVSVARWWVAAGVNLMVLAIVFAVLGAVPMIRAVRGRRPLWGWRSVFLIGLAVAVTALTLVVTPGQDAGNCGQSTAVAGPVLGAGDPERPRCGGSLWPALVFGAVPGFALMGAALVGLGRARRLAGDGDVTARS